MIRRVMVEYEWASDISKRVSKCELWFITSGSGNCVCVCRISKTGRAHKMEVALIWHFVHAEQRGSVYAVVISD